MFELNDESVKGVDVGHLGARLTLFNSHFSGKDWSILYMKDALLEVASDSGSLHLFTLSN